METNDNNIAIIGLGNQAKAWALNLRDSGYRITILLRKDSSSFKSAASLKLETAVIEEALPQFKNILLLIPDDQQAPFLEKYGHLLLENSRVVYAHGWAIACENIATTFPQFSHLLLAPKAISSEVRYQFETKGKLAAVYSVEASTSIQNDVSWLKKLATAIGITGLYQSSAKDETYADLFSEQSLLCGLLPYAAKKSFDLLISKGISKEVAYFECWLEVKLIADAMVKMGPESFFQLISPNALLGAQKAQHLIFDKVYQEKLEMLFREIEDGDFVKFTKSTDIDSTRKEMIDYWSNSLLSKVHHEVSDKVISQ
ncbi:hypothetical protein OAT67_09755 [Bacteriovoracaceae bacterium]|nr:hypothetical protein [Bacteriovoracaceae bacterium]